MTNYKNCSRFGHDAKRFKVKSVVAGTKNMIIDANTSTDEMVKIVLSGKTQQVVNNTINKMISNIIADIGSILK